MVKCVIVGKDKMGRPRKRRTFKGVKLVAKPSDALTLLEILQRFIRKEALPVGMEGVYSDQYGDLEKLAKKDITEQMEVADQMREAAARSKKKEKEKKEKEEKERLDKLNPPAPDPSPTPVQKDPQPPET